MLNYLGNRSISRYHTAGKLKSFETNSLPKRIYKYGLFVNYLTIMNILSKRSLSGLMLGSALIGSFALAGTAFADGPSESNHGVSPMPRPAVVGTVASVSGTTLTVTAKNWKHASTTATTYTVNAANATVTKDGAASTVSAIAVGDQVMVRGTVSGTNVTATVINDGKALGRPDMSEKRSDMMDIASRTPEIAGNGQPVIGGKVTAINGSTLTLTNSSNATYTVDATSAKIVKAGVTGAVLSNVAVGDSVIVQGTVNGTSVTASSLIDQGTAPVAGQPASHRGFMGIIGGFFSHLFGF